MARILGAIHRRSLLYYYRLSAACRHRLGSLLRTTMAVWHYLANLEWTEKVQHTCVFCNKANFKHIVYEDNEIIAVTNRTPGGQFHWLIMPKRHIIRDMEALRHSDLALLQKMDAVKHLLVSQHCPDLLGSGQVIAGYHRGRRPLLGSTTIYYPDVVSVHHLHLHVIVRPYVLKRLFKYPAWLPLLWKSDAAAMRQAAASREPEPEPESEPEPEPEVTEASNLIT
ncbi:hypothetical protein B0T19DRAFT_423535 [Cercophora scortea]|uniref:HIT domain-containing protein n=1 Tax=Cercophora scortea TaxID=314031 RepID=A0AAE0IMT4_9PEZI|nr:hypothetical protein B0T19DRAFT_423535 [Cercophora scortea]